MNTRPTHLPPTRRPFQRALTGVLLAALVCGAAALQDARADVVFTRSTANGEPWASYSATFTPTISGNYNLGFYITQFPGRDSSIFLDQVSVSSSGSVIFQSGFEHPTTAAGTALYPTGPQLATVTSGQWAYTNYCGVIDGQNSTWSNPAPVGGNQLGFVQAYSGNLSDIKTATPLPLIAGQTYTIAFSQASRSGTVGDEGTVTYEVRMDYVPPTVAFAVPQRTGWGINTSFGHIYSKAGLPDVLSSANGQSDYVTLWKNNGDGTFTQAAGFNLSIGGDNLEQTVLADMNNDGLDDIVAIARSGLTIYLNNGDGTFRQSGLYSESTTTANAYFPANFQSVHMAVARTSPGGNFDIVLSGAGQTNTWLVFHGNGDGTVAQSPVALSGPSYSGANVKFIDLDGSGYPAITGGVSWGHPLTVYRNNHDGTYTETFSVSADDPNFFLADVAAIDMDHDGIPDLVVATGDGGATGASWTGAIYWYRGLGNDAFDSTRHLAFSGQSQRWSGSAWDSNWFYDTLTAADVDGDGQVDLIATAQNGQPAVLRNNGNATFTKVWASSQTDTNGQVAFAAKMFWIDVTGTGPSLIGSNGIFNAWQTYSSFGEYWGPLLNAAPLPPAPAVASATITQDYGTVFSYAISATNTPTSYAATNLPTGLTLNGNVISGTLPNAVGNFTIGLSASNTGGTGTGTLSLSIIDQTPPVIAVPADITAEATGPNGAAVNFTVSAVDAIDGSVPVVASPASGSTFPLGTTPVGLAATDKSGNTATGSFNVTVHDTTPPTVTASLVNVSRGGDDESAQFFKVVFSATDLVGVNSATANLNGIAVTNGQIVQLQVLREGRPHVEQEDGHLQIRAASFLLTVTGSDTSGNTATATAVPVFNKRGRDSESNNHSKGHDS